MREYSGLHLHADFNPQGSHFHKRRPAVQSYTQLCSHTQPKRSVLQQESFQSMFVAQSLPQDARCTSVVPKIENSSQSRLTTLPLHPDVTPAVVEPLQSCVKTTPSAPGKASCHVCFKLGDGKEAKQELCKSRSQDLSSEDDEEPPDLDMLMREKLIIRENPERYEALCRMNPQIEKNIKKVIRQHPKGLWLSNFAKVYEVITGTPLCHQTYGYNSLLDMILDFRHVVSLTHPCRDGNTMLSPHGKLGMPPLATWVLDVMRLLLRTRGAQGLTVDELLQCFRRLTGKAIDLKEYGLSTYAFVLTLTMGYNLTFEPLAEGKFLLKCHLPQGTRETVPIKTAGATRVPEANEGARANETASASKTALVVDRAPLVRALREMSATEASRNPDIAEYVEIADSSAPSDSREVDEFEQIIMAALTASLPTVDRIRSPPLIVPNNPYPQPDHLEEGKHYVVYVSQIYSVHHFYIQKKGMDSSVRLEALMNQLDLVYNRPESSAFNVGDHVIHVGMACAAPYTYSEGNSDWHRALVVGLGVDPSTCQVLFIDYGTISFVKKRELRFLRNDFLGLPPQAVRATMEYLKPVNSGGWTREVKDAFVKLATDDKTFVCKVLKRRGALHSVSLCITSPDSEAYVSDVLVEQRLALPTLRYKEITTQIMESGPLSTVQQENAPNSPPSVNLSGTTGPQPAYVVQQSQHCTQAAFRPQLTVQAQPHDQTFTSKSQAAKSAQPRDKEAVHAPTFEQFQQEQGVSFAPAVPTTSLPHTSGMHRPTQQCSSKVPPFDIPRQPNKSYYLELFNTHVQRGLSLPRRWAQLVEEEQRLARLHAKSNVQRHIESNAPQTAINSAGDRAPKSPHYPKPTIGASKLKRCSQAVVQDAAQVFEEPHLQNTSKSLICASPAQPCFQTSVQPTFKTTMVLPGVPPAQLQKPGMTETAANRAAHEAAKDEVDVLDLLRQELDGPHSGWAVKLESLKSGYTLIIVNYKDRPYVTTANVCQLLGWSSDVVLQRLKAKNIHFPTLVLERDCNNYWLLDQIASYDVLGLKLQHSQAQQATLIPLENVIDLLNLFDCYVEELKSDIASVLNSYNPRSQYWHLSDTLEEGNMGHRSSCVNHGDPEAEVTFQGRTTCQEEHCWHRM